jgi:hypothetical protein
MVPSLLIQQIRIEGRSTASPSLIEVIELLEFLTKYLVFSLPIHILALGTALTVEKNVTISWKIPDNVHHPLTQRVDIPCISAAG